MKRKGQKHKDLIYKKKKEQSLTAVSFLAALKENLDNDTAFRIALDAFTRYMTSYYERILVSTEKCSQERFDRFKESYERFSEETPYCEVIESSPQILRVKYTRCPFYEILTDQGLEELAYAFCLSDPSFTKRVLPCVIFSREHEIVKGGKYCDHTWKFSTEGEKKG